MGGPQGSIIRSLMASLTPADMIVSDVIGKLRLAWRNTTRVECHPFWLGSDVNISACYPFNRLVELETRNEGNGGAAVANA